MTLEHPGIYHIYNRSNNNELVFFREYNYKYFHEKCKIHLKPLSEIIAWCLMPTHFHFLVEITQKSLQQRHGNLFQQKTKAKEIHSDKYIEAAFHYIHNNPVEAGLALSPKLWKFSSFNEYQQGKSELCNIQRGLELLGLSEFPYPNDNSIILTN